MLEVKQRRDVSWDDMASIEDPIAAKAEIDKDDLFGQVDFDLNGNSEKINAIINPIDSLDVLNAKEKAIELTKTAFPNVKNAHNNEADAFRHATWNFLMTKLIGSSEAKKFADAHER